MASQTIPTLSVAHALPGRVRLRLAPADSRHGTAVAAAFAGRPGVRGVRWTGPNRSLTVWFDRRERFSDLVAAVERDGLPEVDPAGGERPLWRHFVLPAASLALALSGLGLPARLGIALCALPIGRRAAGSLRDRRLTIDVLDAAGVAALLATGDLLAAGVTVGLVETGERIRRQAHGHARRVVRGWMGEDRRGVRVVRGSSEPRIPLAEVRTGERVVLYAGENVPVDGRVVSGAGNLDNRTWTGEWRPQPVDPDSSLLAGSTLVDGRVVVEVEATGEATRASRLAAAIEDAIAADTEVADLARRIADRFVLPVLLVGGATFALTRDLQRLVSVLITDFGAGLRVSIPTAMLTTMIAAGRSGIIFKSGRAIEALGGVDTIVLDKTGTLTEGRPAVVGVEPAGDRPVDECLRLAASAEGHLPHPMARAVRRAARARGLEPSEPADVRYLPGGGVAAVVEGQDVLVGDHRMLESQGVEVPAERPDSSVAHVAVEGRLAATIHVRDEVRGSATAVVSRLRAMGIRRLILATGDNPGAARPVAEELGLDECLPGVTPEDKADLVRRLRRSGARVALIGDGINDASAMASADVGIAVARAADLARDTADVTLLSDDLTTLVRAVELARAGMRLARENIGIVALPNGVALGLAILGRMSPLAATVVNNGSTLLAASNGMRPLLSRG